MCLRRHELEHYVPSVMTNLVEAKFATKRPVCKHKNLTTTLKGRYVYSNTTRKTLFGASRSRDGDVHAAQNPGNAIPYFPSVRLHFIDCLLMRRSDCILCIPIETCFANTRQASPTSKIKTQFYKIQLISLSGLINLYLTAVYATNKRILISGPNKCIHNS